MHSISVRSGKREELINITRQVNDYLVSRSAGDGLCLIWCPHTTAGLTVNEGADPLVAADIVTALKRIVPEDGYLHAEGNSPAHLKSALMGVSLMLPVTGGRLALGTWQAVFFCEFDGPRNRRVQMAYQDYSRQ